MSVPADRHAFEALKAESARLKEDNERLEERNKQLEKEVNEQRQRMKIDVARIEIERSLESGEIEVGQIYLISSLPVEMRHEELRMLIDDIRSREKKEVIFLCDQSGNCVVFCSDYAQKMGLCANDLMALANDRAGGSGGGRPNLAQGKLKEFSNFLEIKRYLEGRIRERFPLSRE